LFSRSPDFQKSPSRISQPAAALILARVRGSMAPPGLGASAEMANGVYYIVARENGASASRAFTVLR